MHVTVLISCELRNIRGTLTHTNALRIVCTSPPALYLGKISGERPAGELKYPHSGRGGG